MSLKFKKKKNDNKEKITIPLPYYVSQNRILDLYSMINDGYAEYKEVFVSNSEARNNNVSGNAGVGLGNKMFNIGAKTNIGANSETFLENSSRSNKVQTLPSMLKTVYEFLLNNNLIKNTIEEAEIGDYVDVSMRFIINSAHSYFEELKETILFLLEASKLDKSPEGQKQQKANKAGSKDLLDSIDTVKSIFTSEELLDENNENFAVFGKFEESNLYTINKQSLNNLPVRCLCKIINIHEEGTKLLKEDPLTKIKLANFLDSFNNIIENEDIKKIFEVESNINLEITNKKVYEIEIIALYQ